MAFTLNIDTENPAFSDGNDRAEIARILRDAADKVENNDGRGPAFIFTVGHSETLRDIDGNDVGRAKIHPS